MNKQTPTPTRRVTAQKTANGWTLEVDNQSWVDLMQALSIAIDHCQGRKEGEYVAKFQALRSAISRG